ncbi:MAG: hypothetical protein ACPGO5_00780 [Patescibacteria group bacterium]
MFLSVHSSAALVLATMPLHAALLFPISFISHYIVDSIPHGDEHLIPDSFTEKQKEKRMLLIAGIDGLIILLILGAYFYTHPSTPLWRGIIAAFLACLPDGLQFIEIKTKGRFKLIHTHQKMHTYLHGFFKKEIPFKYGILVQIVFLGLMITLW